MTERRWNRREILTGAGLAALGLAGSGSILRGSASSRDFKISVDGWTFHRTVFGGKLKQMDLFQVVREEFDIGGFSLVNTMLEVPTWEYTRRLGEQASKYNVEIPLIMVDGERPLGHTEKGTRMAAVKDHLKWLNMASDLGCHSIRVNWRGENSGSAAGPALIQAFVERSVDAFTELCRHAAEMNLNVIIENHGGPSSYPQYLLALIQAVNLPNFGILPDFGNFPDEVDRYQAVDQFMHYAKAVSAKCHDFGPDGRETKTDFEKMIEIVVDKHGYHGWVGIEYEGDKLSEKEGLKAGRDLLIQLRDNQA